MFAKKSIFAMAFVLVFGLSACGAEMQRTQELMADYPSYSQSELVAESTLIAVGEVVATEYTVVMPRFEGDTPESNPLFGLSEEEKAAAMEEAEGVPSTAVTLKLSRVIEGAAQPGQDVVIVQTGGVIGGVSYEVAGEKPLSEGETYLLFARDSFDGAYVILLSLIHI